MSRFTVISKVSLLPILVFTFVLEGCAVFRFMGDTVSSGYENTVTYFNVYYNTRRAFKDAEAGIVAAAKASQGKTTTPGQTSTIPPDVLKNLDLVIDKCSNILAYHAKSSYVDDALMMTGKAFYYKGEYSKSERKFLELITQYPESSLLLEAQLWYTRSEEKLGELEAAHKSADALVTSADQQGEENILAQAYSLEASLEVHDNAIPAAIEYYQKSAKVADSDMLKADALANIGQLYFDDGQYEKSIDALLQVDEYSSDAYQVFRSKLLAAQAYRNLNRFDKALAVADELSRDYRFKDFLGTILLERATILLASGRSDQAVDSFRMLDTSYVRSETGALAAFQLAQYYERTIGDYQKAKEYYARASTFPGTKSAEQATRKGIIFNSYFSLRKDLSVADSLLTLVSGPDTLGSALNTHGNPVPDSSVIQADSLKRSRAPLRPRISVDSVNALQARASVGLGELFYTDLANPDSAFFWLRYSLLHQYNESGAPRILYILNELATSYPAKTTVSSEEYRAQLIRDFPNSYFAGQLQNLSNNETKQRNSADSAEDAYINAEALIEAGKNVEAVDSLEAILTRYPGTGAGARSRYSIGWLYENRLGRYDSAAAEYKLLIAQFPGTPYARAVSTKMLDTLALAPVKSDTTALRTIPQLQKKDTTGVEQASILNPKQNINKPNGTLSRRARILQSSNLKKIERE